MMLELGVSVLMAMAEEVRTVRWQCQGWLW